MSITKKWELYAILSSVLAIAFELLTGYLFMQADEPSKQQSVIFAAVVTMVFLLFSMAVTFKWWKVKSYFAISEEQRIEMARLDEAAKEDELLYRAIEREARYLVKEIPKHLSVQNKLDHLPSYDEHKGRRGRRKKRLVQFDAVLITKTEIWFHFNGRKLPYGVSFSDIRDPQYRVRENLQYAIHRPCRFHEDYEYNLFLRVGLKNSVMGVPKTVKWSRVYPMLPKANSFAVAVGVSEYGKLIYQDLRSWPHGIVAGSTGMGKTIMLTQWIVTLMKRNSPDMCQFIFVDLKDGVEFYKFRELPHTLAFVDQPDGVQEQLEWLTKQYTTRMEMFKGVCRDIKGWNAQKSRKLPYIFLFIDELAIITLDKKLGGDAVDIMIPLVQRARAAGIHIIVATQVLQAEVLPLLIRANFDGRLAFSVPGIAESILVLNNGMAAGLEVEGRCVFKSRAAIHVLQGPMITEKEVNAVIEEVTSGGAKPEDAPFDEMDLFRLALYNLGGLASWRELWDATEGAMSQKKIKDALKAYTFDFNDPAGSVIDIDGDTYILSQPFLSSEGNKPRRLVAVNGRLPDTEEDLIEMAWGQGVGGEIDTDNPPSLAENDETIEDELEVFENV